MTIICQKLIPSKSKYSESRLINTIYHIIIIQLKQKCNNIHNEKKPRPAVQAIFTDTETFFNCSFNTTGTAQCRLFIQSFSPSLRSSARTRSRSELCLVRSSWFFLRLQKPISMSFFIGPESMDLGSHFSSFGFHLSPLGFQVDLGGLNSSLSWGVAFYEKKLNPVQKCYFKTLASSYLLRYPILYIEIAVKILKSVSYSFTLSMHV